MSRHIKKMKGLFVISAVILVVTTIVGVQSLRAFEPQKLIWSLSYLTTRFEYSRHTGAGLAESAIAAFHSIDIAEAVNDDLVSAVPVFVYHGIVSEADRFNMTQETFKDQMFALKNAGYYTISVEDFEAFMKGEKKLSGKPFLLTFDDGRMDSYRGADPILKALDYTAVMYVAVNSSMPEGDHSSYYISEHNIQRMIDSQRWQIGSHAFQEDGGFVTVSADGTEGNFLSSLKWLEETRTLETEEEYRGRLEHEVVDSRQRLEEIFNTSVVSFSYPFGDYGQQSNNNINAVSTIHDLVEQNYSFAFRQVWPEDGEAYFNSPGDDMNYLKRFETPTEWSGEQLLSFLDANKEKVLPLADGFHTDIGWHGTWGNVHLGEFGGLVMKATESSTGASAFLGGSESWQDYTYNAIFDWTVGSHVSLMSQYQNSENYLVCTFGQGRVKIEKNTEGEITKLKDAKHRLGYSHQGNFGMRVVGDSVQCLIDNTVVASATTTAGAGGVGIRIWDPETGLAAAHVINVTVIPVKN